MFQCCLGIFRNIPFEYFIITSQGNLYFVVREFAAALLRLLGVWGGVWGRRGAAGLLLRLVWGNRAQVLQGAYGAGMHGIHTAFFGMYYFFGIIFNIFLCILFSVSEKYCAGMHSMHRVQDSRFGNYCILVIIIIF